MRLAEPIPVTTAHGRMLREPKGGPDVTLAGDEQQAEELLRAGNILSVQGWTARIVLLNVDALADLPGDEREALLGNGPLVNILSDDAPDAAEVAAAALEAIRG